MTKAKDKDAVRAAYRDLGVEFTPASSLGACSDISVTPEEDEVFTAMEPYKLKKEWFTDDNEKNI